MLECVGGFSSVDRKCCDKTMPSAKTRYNRKKMENHSLKLSTSTRHGGDQLAKRISNIVKTSASVASVFPSHSEMGIGQVVGCQWNIVGNREKLE